MKLAQKAVLVTGADGFIGSHLVEELVQRGAKVKAFVWYNAQNSYGWIDALDQETQSQIEVVSGDICDPDSVNSAVKGTQVVLHLAALIGIPYSYTAPFSYIETNMHGTLNVLQAARQHNVEKIVHTSTSEVYGTAQFVPITENHPLHAQSPYAATKVGADQLAISFFDSFKTPVAVLRPFNTYGPRQSARAVIPTIISQLAAGSKEVHLGNTVATRDFLYVKDTAGAFIAMAESEESLGKVIQCGTGFEISVHDLFMEIAGLMGVDAEIEQDEERVRPAGSEVERLCADPSLARELLGWTPDYAGLDGLRRGLKETIEWFSDPKNLALYRHYSYTV